VRDTWSCVSLVQKAFEARGLAPQIVLSAQDSDVIKT